MPPVRVSPLVHRVASALMLVAALLYLVHFVDRGWMPHDEGTLGQAAERALLGATPHVDFEDPYTGGLSRIYALVFRVAGIELLNLRWLLFSVASASLWLTYAILRRFLSPVVAALAAWLALAWSFPNYFAGLPSWWLLLFALVTLWAMVRFIDTHALRYAALAGLAVGAAIAIKQTGAYLAIAFGMTLLYSRQGSGGAFGRSIDRVLRYGVALAGIAFGVFILGSRLAGAEGMYLFAPILACAIALALSDGTPRAAQAPSTVAALSVAISCAMVPLALLVIPYVVHHQLWALFDGTILLPQRRLSSSSLPMPGLVFIVTGLPLVALLMPWRHTTALPRATWLQALCWLVAIVLPLVALWNITAYQLLWQSARAFASLVSIAICWSITYGSLREDGERRRVLFLCAAMLSWASLNQFPFAAAVYFCYVTPLAVIAGVALGDASLSLRRPGVLPWVASLLLFAGLSLHRGDIVELGRRHLPVPLTTPLDLPRAHLRVSAGDAASYRGVARLVAEHLDGGQLKAAPDCPEVYFLSGLYNPRGVFFDFFADDPGESEGKLVEEWTRSSVIVINSLPHFSRPLPAALVSELRSAFPQGESLGKFEVRWR